MKNTLKQNYTPLNVHWSQDKFKLYKYVLKNKDRQKKIGLLNFKYSQKSLKIANQNVETCTGCTCGADPLFSLRTLSMSAIIPILCFKMATALAHCDKTNIIKFSPIRINNLNIFH